MQKRRKIPNSSTLGYVPKIVKKKKALEIQRTITA